MWMLSTKMMPAVAVLVPFIWLQESSVCSTTKLGLIIILTMMNLPIIVWMALQLLQGNTGEILEAARMDGATLGKEIVYVLAPMAVQASPRRASQHHPSWNEAFWTLNLSASQAARFSTFIAILFQS